MTNYCNIGKLVASFGVQGELVLQHHLGKKTALKGLDVIFIEIKKAEMLPYFIRSARIKSDDEVYLQLDSVDSREAALKLTRKEVWLTEDRFHQYAAKSAPVSLLGFTLVNEGEPIGEVLEVIEQPHQLLCRIDLEGREALIPVHEATLQKIDKKKKLVHLRLPDGLLDIYR